MRYSMLSVLAVLLCTPLGLAQPTLESDALDEKDLLEMLCDGSCESSPPPAVADGQHSQPSTVPVAAEVQPVYDRLRGEKTIMVIRIDTLDGNSDYCDAQCAWKLMFGPEMQFGHQPTLDAATREASYGQMWFSRPKSAVVSVQLPEQDFGTPCHFGKVGERARDLVKSLHGNDPDSYDFVYHFLPNNMRCNFGGVAFLHGKHAYSAPGYTRNGIIKHEVGHNYGLHHARALGGPFGSPGEEDGWDTGSSMGGGVIFSTAERYMLGWVSGDAVQDLGEIRAPNGGDSDLPGNPKLMAYWDRGSCGPKGDDFNWGWCGDTRGNCPNSKAVGKDVCPSGLAELQFKEAPFKHHECEFFWFAQYECTGVPGTTTTTTATTLPSDAHDVLLKIAAARHPLNTPYGPHTVIFSLWRDAVFAVSYRTPHGTDGASFKANPDRFGWVVNHKVNVHRLHGGRAVGRGIAAPVVYAGVADGERFVLDKGPASRRGNFTLEVCSADENQAIVSLVFHAGRERPSKCPGSSTTTTASTTSSSMTSSSTTSSISSSTTSSSTSTSVTEVPPTTSSTAPTTSSSTTTTTMGIAIQSGDTIFLQAHSGDGNHIDVEGSAVQARWISAGGWQAITIEKEHGGVLTSGDAVYLKTHTGAYIHVQGQDVRAEWSDRGDWQKMIIERKMGDGPITPNDLVCLKAHTGKHLDVEAGVVRARWTDCGSWQTLHIQKEVAGALFSGDLIHLLAHTGKHVDADGSGALRARWEDRGSWQTFTLKNYGGRAIYSGDVVFLEAHTGALIDVEGEAVQARWKDWGTWQRLIIERKEGSGAIMPNDTIFLRAHTGKVVEIEGEDVRARWDELGSWQSLVIEKSAARRLENVGMLLV